MNKIIFHIVLSIVCILLPIAMYSYFIWDFYQPRTGPIGDGKLHLKAYQLLPGILLFLTGVMNVISALYRYREHRESEKEASNRTEQEKN